MEKINIIYHIFNTIIGNCETQNRIDVDNA